MRFFIALLLLITCSLNASPQQNAPASGNPDVYAVVVGVSRYQDADIPQLQFANRDAVIFSEFLMSKAGGAVPKENIRLLTDSGATQAAVYTALSGLAKKCKKDDLIFFYFSGHGDLENVTLFNNGYLICYNSPPANYIGLAVSIRDVNELANSFSVKTGANVVLITDACHSGNMSDSRSAGNVLSGQQLIDANEKVVRIASSKPDELSNEKIDWGGGRGVFSYYLVNGLKGLADKSRDGIVTFGELKKFLESSLQNDPVLKMEKKVQTPVLSGREAFRLSTVNPEDLQAVRQQSAVDSVSFEQVRVAAVQIESENQHNLSPEDYFIAALKKEDLATMVDRLNLDELAAAEIPFAMINWLKDKLGARESWAATPSQDMNMTNAAVQMAKTDSMMAVTGRKQLAELVSILQQNRESMERLNENLVIVFDDKAQEVINQYLKGDEAELERRRYYNSSISNYDAYPRILSVALKLTPPNEFFYNILKVKLHYFSGVVHRMKIPITENHDSLINLAFAEQQQALELEKHAAYIYNELGILYMAKKQTAEAEKYFSKATTLATRWALPWANLSYLYAVTGRSETGFNACYKADSLQPGLPCVSNNFGLLNENKGNLLYAEEYYRRSIDLNSRHYLPFERLGYLYLNSARYALADSFFYEAEKRKMGLNFQAGMESLYWNDPLGYTRDDWSSCALPATTAENDLMAFFYKGMAAYRNKDTAGAIRMLKKVIGIDPQNPLAFHYLGKLFYEQKKWEEAELMFNFAIRFNLDPGSFPKYCDSVVKAANFSYPHTCFENFFRKHYYDKIEDFYFMANVYETWGHYAAAETMYDSIRILQPGKIGGYVKSWRLLEKLGRYTEAEKRIYEFRAFDAERTDKELNAFYRRAIDKFPADNHDWVYRLGLLLYNRAKATDPDKYLDRIVWFPKLNKEVFVDTAVLILINSSKDYEVTDFSDITYREEFKELRLNKEKESLLLYDAQRIVIPGTQEEIMLAKDILMPRKDGIFYLQKAAESISGKEIQADILNKVGDIYVWAGSNKQAYPYYARSVELAPGNANARLQLVDAGVVIHQNKATLEQLNYLYNNGQINFPKRMLLAEMFMYAGQFDRSKKILDEAGQIHPYRLGEFTELNGRLNLLAGKPDAAIGLYKQYITEINADAADSYYTIARLYAGKQNSNEAFVWLKKAISNGFSYSYIFELDPLMNELRKKPEWEKLVAKPKKTKLKQKGVLFDY